MCTRYWYSKWKPLSLLDECYVYVFFSWLDIFINQNQGLKHKWKVRTPYIMHAKKAFKPWHTAQWSCPTFSGKQNWCKDEPGVWPWHPPMHPSLPLAPGWCEVGSGEPPSTASGRRAETNQHLTSTKGLSEKLQECLTVLTLIHGWFMNSVMVILCVGSVLRRVLISCLAAKQLFIINNYFTIII